MPEQTLQEALPLTERQLRFRQAIPVTQQAEAAANPAAVAPLQDTTASLDIQDAYTAFQATELQKQVERSEQGSLHEWGQALQTTGTAHLVRQGFNWLERTDTEDPDFKMSPEELRDVSRDYGITLTDNLLENLRDARSLEAVHQIARDQQEQDKVHWKLANSGVKGFAVHLVDPVEVGLAFGAAAITGGPGGLAVLGARGLRAGGASLQASRRSGQVIHGAGQAGAAVGANLAFDQAGQDITLADYILSAGLPLALGTALMPTKHIDEAIGYARTRADGQLEIHSGSSRADAQAAASRAEAPSAKVPTVQAMPKWTMPEVIRNIRKTADSTLQPVLKRFEEGIRLVQSRGAKVVGSELSEGSVPAVIAATVSKATQQLVQGAVTKALREPLEALQAAAQAAGKSTDDIVQETLDAVRSGAPVQASVRAPLDKLLGLKAGDLEQLLEAPRRQASEATAPTGQSTGQAAAVPNATAEAPAGADSAVQEGQASVQAAQSAISTVQEAGSSNKLVAAAQGTGRWFQGFISEFDKLTARKDVLRNYLGRLLDDPLSRYPDKQTASSQLRINQNLANNERRVYDTAVQDYTLQTLGKSFSQTKWGYSTEYLRRKLEIENNILEVKAERDWLKQKGYTDAEVNASMHGVKPELLKLISITEDIHAKSAERARLQGLNGFENEMSSVGYWSRKWNYAPMRAIVAKFGEPRLLEFISVAIKRSTPEMSDLESLAIAKAVFDRTKANGTGSRSDFMGQLGKVETDNILELLRQTDTDEAIIESVSRRLKQNVDEQGQVSYSKARIPMDMRTTMTMPDGTELRLLDLMDNNLSALMESYQRSMAGRSALASIGIGGGEAGAETFITNYRHMVDSTGIPEHTAQAMQEQLRSLLADFTGIKPDTDILTNTQTSLKDLAAATLLSGSGLWQVGETGVILARKGGFNSVKYMLKNAPGIKQLLRDVGSNDELFKELEFATGLNFVTDTRMQPFLRQLEIDMGASTNLQKYTHSAREFSSTLNGMRWVHGMQSRMLTNLNMQDLWKAGKGDKRALQQAFSNGATPELLEAVRRVSVSEGGSLKSAGLEGLTHAEIQDYMHVLSRMQDSTLLHMRPGWGASYSRSAVGQLLGQFTSYVSMAHNRILRGTYQETGATGVALVLAYSLPFTLIATYLQELRKGNALDLDNDSDLIELMQGAFKYAPIAGYLGDVVSLVSGNYSSRGVAALNFMQVPGEVLGSVGDLATGDPSKAASGVLKAGASLSVMGAFPGTRTLIKALEEGDE